MAPLISLFRPPPASEERRAALREEGFFAACKSKEVPSTTALSVHIQDHPVLICRHRMGFHALDALCPHKDLSIAGGSVIGGEVICPHHQYRFNLKSGYSQVRRCPPLAVHDVEIDGDTIFVRLAPLDPSIEKSKVP